MFTGIIVATGRLLSISAKDGDLDIGIDAAALDAERVAVGDSVSVQGVCLTVTRLDGPVFHADVSRETMAKTTLGTLGQGARVNLEPSLRAGDPLGGHLVSGHVDAAGTLAAIFQDGRSSRLQFVLPAPLLRYVAPKGSICIDGVSLTVNEVSGQRFDVNVIPHTREVTTLGELRAGAAVNIEIDLIARYLERLLQPFADLRKDR
ncbi:MAG: riboflavin synthase [Steroidobacteraceae bacterium]